MISKLRFLKVDDEGANLSEYGLLLFLIACGAIVSIAMLGVRLQIQYFQLGYLVELIAKGDEAS